jgi:hypothetical protein
MRNAVALVIVMMALTTIQPIECMDEYNDTWPVLQNETAWWDANSTASQFIDSIMDLFGIPSENTTTVPLPQYVFITYVQMIPMMQCADIDRVVDLFDKHLGEANPTAWITSEPIEFGGEPCSTSQCVCVPTLRRKLAFRILKIQTKSTIPKLAPMRHFPLTIETVSVR